MGASEGMLGPLDARHGRLGRRPARPAGHWSLGRFHVTVWLPASDQTALYDGALAVLLASAQYALVSEVCAFDTTAAWSSVRERPCWCGQQRLAGWPGLVLRLWGAVKEKIVLTLEVLDLEFLDPRLRCTGIWRVEQVQAPDGWTDHVWTLNGTVLDAQGGAVIHVGRVQATIRSRLRKSCVGLHRGITQGSVGCPGRP